MTAFEWDPLKAASNAREHGVQFADAVAVLEDEMAITVLDGLARLLAVVYTWRGSTVRIISARSATRKAQHQYLENR